MTSPIFPNNLWDGKSLERENILVRRPPGPEDWDQIVAEVIAVEQYALYLKNLINNLSGGGSATPGGSNGQIQFNNNGSFAGFNGNALTNDINGSTDSVAIGINSFALGEQSLAIGHQCVASNDQCIALGYQCTAGDPPKDCTINGLTITVSGNYINWFYSGDDGAFVLSNLSGGTGPTIAYGSLNENSANGGVFFNGTNTILTLKAIITNHTSGSANMRDDSTCAYAEGCISHALSYISHAEGYNTTTTGNYSHAEGINTTASGNTSHAEGSNTVAGYISHAEGSNTSADFISHAEGSNVVASGQVSHAEGNNTIASGNYSHAGGTGTTANLSCEWSRSDNDGLPGKIGHLIASGISTNNTPINLLITRNDHLVINTNCSFGFLIHIAAYKTDGSIAAYFIRQGLIKNVGGTVSIVGSIVTIGTDINANSWNVSITADTVNQALAITVTGEASVNWRARIDFTEVGI